MSNKSLSEKEKSDLKQMVITGVAPEDIANHFKISISSVHNHKQRLKNNGVKFPNVRGQRPVGKYSDGNDKEIASENNFLSSYRFLINKTIVTVSKDAKSVHITKNGAVIKF